MVIEFEQQSLPCEVGVLPGNVSGDQMSVHCGKHYSGYLTGCDSLTAGQPTCLSVPRASAAGIRRIAGRLSRCT